MVELKFNYLNDSIILKFSAGTITNITSLTLYEDAQSNEEAVKYRPTWDELETPITRNYLWDKDTNLTLRCTWSRTSKQEAGFKICDLHASFYYSSDLLFQYFGFQYPNPVWFTTTSLEGTSLGKQLLVYDTTNKVTYSCTWRYGRFVGGYFPVGKDYYTPQTIVIEKTNSIMKSGYYPNLAYDYVGTQQIENYQAKIIEPVGVPVLCKLSRISDSGRLYNKIFSKITPPSYPNQNPDDDNDDNGQSPSSPSLPGDGDVTSDPIPDPPSLPTFDVTNTGFVVIYNPSVTEIRELAYFMWSGEFVDLIKKMFASPFEAIISLKMLFCPVTAGASQTVWLGNVETDVTMAKVTSQFTDVDMGTLNVNEFFGSFADYAPFTKIQIYLPFIGFKDLNVDEVMNSQLHLRYRVDVYSGACIAYLTVTKTIKSTNLNSILYQFDGNCAMEIPFTSNDNSRYVAAIMNSVASSALSLANTSGFTLPTPAKGFNQKAKPGNFELGSLAPVANGMLDIMSAKPNVQRAGSLSGAVSAMAVKQPYLIIHRPIAQMPANYQHYIGIPLNLTRTLSNVKGLTVVSQVFMTSEVATDEEIVMITEMLKNGVIL